MTDLEEIEFSYIAFFEIFHKWMVRIVTYKLKLSWQESWRQPKRWKIIKLILYLNTDNNTPNVTPIPAIIWIIYVATDVSI